MVYGERKKSLKWVEVMEICRPDGTIVPTELRWEDGRRWRLRSLGKRENVNFDHLYATRYPVKVIVNGKEVERDLFRMIGGGPWFIVMSDTTLPQEPKYVDPRYGEMPC